MIGLWIGIAIYALVLLVGLLMFRLWVIRWHIYVAAITAAGAVIGFFGFLLLGPLLTERALPDLLLQGLRDGAFLAFIWAPGTAFVLCIIQAHRRRNIPR